MPNYTAKSKQNSSSRRGVLKIRKNEHGESQLHQACIRGDVQQVQSLLDQGHPVNIQDNAGWTPLHEACNHNRFEVVEVLVEAKNADLNVQDQIGRITPLMDACSQQNFSIARLLISHGADVTKLDAKGDTVIDYLKRYGEDDDLDCQLLTKQVEDEMRKRNFTPKSATSRKAQQMSQKLTRSEKLAVDKKAKFKKLNSTQKRKAITSSDDDDDTICEDEQDAENLLDHQEKHNMQMYKNTIQSVRHKNTTKRKAAILDDIDSDKKKSSFVTEDEFQVQQEWLDDDLGIFQHNTKQKSENKIVLLPMSSPEPETPTSDDDIDRDEDLLSDISGSDSVQVSPEKSQQEEAPDKSDDEQDIKLIDFVKTCPPSTSASTELKFDVVPNNVPVTRKIIVHVDDKKMMIPVLESDVNQNIGWFTRQISNRYSTQYGKRPIIRLLNGQSVELCIDDQLNLFIDEELIAKVISWDRLPLHEKYDQVCRQYDSVNYANIKSKLRQTHETGELSLENCGLRDKLAQAVFLTLQDNYEIVSMNLRGNRLSIENCRQLGQSLVCLTLLKFLNLRNTGLSNTHLEVLVESLQSSDKQLISSLQRLDLSFNCFDNEVVQFLIKLVEMCPKLTNLDLVGCDFGTPDEFATISNAKNSLVIMLR